jgi:hypothetical protein
MKLRLQLVYLEACIKETMRLRPAVVNLLRKNELPDGGLDILGFPIPSGAHMAPFVFGVHRDPTYWERPEEFLPERFLPVGAAVCTDTTVWTIQLPSKTRTSSCRAHMNDENREAALLTCDCTVGDFVIGLRPMLPRFYKIYVAGHLTAVMRVPAPP